MARLTVASQVKPFQTVATRWLMAATLVFGTYNPSGDSYFHWIRDSARITPVQAAVGIFLLVAWVAVGRIAFVALWFRGVGVVLSLIFAGIMATIGLGWSTFQDMRITGYTILFWVTTILAVGMSWAILQKAITGERDVIRQPP